jgi:hypothetical protein
VYNGGKVQLTWIHGSKWQDPWSFCPSPQSQCMQPPTCEQNPANFRFYLTCPWEKRKKIDWYNQQAKVNIQKESNIKY